MASLLHEGWPQDNLAGTISLLGNSAVNGDRFSVGRLHLACHPNRSPPAVLQPSMSTPQQPALATRHRHTVRTQFRVQRCLCGTLNSLNTLNIRTTNAASARQPVPRSRLVSHPLPSPAPRHHHPRCCCCCRHPSDEEPAVGGAGAVHVPRLRPAAHQRGVERAGRQPLHRDAAVRPRCRQVSSGSWPVACPAAVVGRVPRQMLLQPGATRVAASTSPQLQSSLEPLWRASALLHMSLVLQDAPWVGHVQTSVREITLAVHPTLLPPSGCRCKHHQQHSAATTIRRGAPASSDWPHNPLHPARHGRHKPPAPAHSRRRSLLQSVMLRRSKAAVQEQLGLPPCNRADIEVDLSVGASPQAAYPELSYTTSIPYNTAQSPAAAPYNTLQPCSTLPAHSRQLANCAKPLQSARSSRPLSARQPENAILDGFYVPASWMHKGCRHWRPKYPGGACHCCSIQPITGPMQHRPVILTAVPQQHLDSRWHATGPNVAVAGRLASSAACSPFRTAVLFSLRCPVRLPTGVSNSLTFRAMCCPCSEGVLELCLTPHPGDLNCP
jgi:hypothetical protein